MDHGLKKRGWKVSEKKVIQAHVIAMLKKCKKKDAFSKATRGQRGEVLDGAFFLRACGCEFFYPVFYIFFV